VSSRTVITTLLAFVLCASCSTDEARKTERYDKGKALAAASKFGEAILEFRNAIQLDPNFAPAHLALAQAYAETDDTVNAYRSYQRAADLSPDSVDTQLAAARYLLHVRLFQDARARAERVIALDPSIPDAHIILGSALGGSSDVKGAIAQVEEAISLAPGKTSGYESMGSLLLTQGRIAEALAQFEKAVAVAPDSVDARVALATYHWSTGDTRRAEECLKKALEIQPANAFASRAMALLYVSTGRGDRAEPFLKAVARGLRTVESELPLADFYVRKSRLKEAREILERTAASGNGSAIVRLGSLDYAEGQRERAHARVDALLIRQPSNSEALIAKARWLLNDGQPDEALLRAESVTQRDPGNAASYLLLGDTYVALGQRADATAAYTNALRHNPRAAAAYTALSRLSLQKDNPAAAVEFARGALLNEPGNDNARVLLAKGLLERSETKRAGEEIAVLLRRRSADPTITALNGSLKMALGDRVAARKEFEKALVQDARNIDALTGLTSLDAAEGRIGSARERLAGALAGDARNVPLLLLTARADFQAGDFSTGERRVRSVIELDPSQGKAYELLGAAYIKQQKLPAALAEFERVIEKNPRSIGALTVTGMIHEAMGHSLDAEKAYQRALQIDPRATVAGNNLAFMLAERGDNLEYALVLARETVSMTKNDPVVLDTLGWVYLKKGQPALAIPEFQRALGLAPGNATYHFHLGLAYADAKDVVKARAALRQALQLNPNFPGAAAARDRLSALGV
jgi:tetratricopeptide (TPR) repeat protein